MICLWASYENFFVHLRKESDLELDPESDPDPLVRGTDPGIRIRTKMSRVPNTDFVFWQAGGNKEMSSI
jgi:hypothetical protein